MEDSEKLKIMAMEYYFELFKSDGEIGGQLMKGAFPYIGDEVCEELVKECTEEEAKLALKGMCSYKALRPGGYQDIFFKTTWELIGVEVYPFVKGALEDEEVSVVATEALLVFTPKGTKPSSMRDFMPLSICNTIYILVLKVVVNRLKEVWKGLISPYQASFVPSCQSTDNIIMCQEFI